VFSMPDGFPDREPARKELAAIVAEWPLIEADLAVVDREIGRLAAAKTTDELQVRRARRWVRRVLRPVVCRGGDAA
jgi:hypothetical protein